jgi:hypothetical protein
MTTPCHAGDCLRPDDFTVGSRTNLCAHHYKADVAALGGAS